jgi:HPt (histidine-containing phosphotransfer) domain-containing protein
MELVQHRLRELIARHCASLRTNAVLLVGFVAAMNEPDNVSSQAARDALHLAHQIAGASGSIGFGEVSALASDIEQALQPIVAVNGMPSPAQGERINRLVLQLQAAAAALTPESSTLFDLDPDAFNRLRRLA